MSITPVEVDRKRPSANRRIGPRNQCCTPDCLNESQALARSGYCGPCSRIKRKGRHRHRPVAKDLGPCRAPGCQEAAVIEASRLCGSCMRVSVTALERARYAASVKSGTSKRYRNRKSTR